MFSQRMTREQKPKQKRSINLLIMFSYEDQSPSLQKPACLPYWQSFGTAFTPLDITTNLFSDLLSTAARPLFIIVEHFYPKPISVFAIESRVKANNNNNNNKNEPPINCKFITICWSSVDKQRLRNIYVLCATARGCEKKNHSDRECKDALTDSASPRPVFILSCDAA